MSLGEKKGRPVGYCVSAVYGRSSAQKGIIFLHRG